MKLITAFIMCVLGCDNSFMISDNLETHVIVESFQQNELSQNLDVLVVVDTSCSMMDDLSAVGVGISTLQDNVSSLTIDYKIGFITADPNNLGFVGEYDSSTSQIDISLAPTLLPSSLKEMGFTASYTFMMSEESFIRDYADLLIFFLSDEDEQGTITADVYYYDWMISYKAEQEFDIINIISTYGSSCGDYGKKYDELSTIMEKVSIDLCLDDWKNWLSSTSYLVSLEDSIELSYIPIEESIVVYVDHDKVWNWWYDSDSNTVFFEEPPAPGVWVEVGYKIIDE